jgi:uncharacterized protein YndB with AHSA1/START domain
MAALTVDVIIDAPPHVVWNAVVDWPAQSTWMLGTTVRVSAGDGRSVGSELEAITGVGGRGVVDTMRITHWDPPRLCDVVHTGSVVRGTGRFEVIPLPSGRSRFVWHEDLEIPLGAVGRAGWPLARPLAKWGVQRSLNDLARRIEAGELGRA